MRVLLLLLAFWIGFAAPVRADDIADAQAAIRSQAEAFGRDDAATAYGYAAPAIQGMFGTPDIFMNMVRNGYAPVYRHKSFEFGEGQMADGIIAQKVHILDADGVGSAVHAAAPAGRQSEDHRLQSAQSRAGGVRDASRLQPAIFLASSPSQISTDGA